MLPSISFVYLLTLLEVMHSIVVLVTFLVTVSYVSSIIPEDNDIQNKNNIIHNNNIDNDIQNDNNIQDNQLGNNIDNSDHDVNSEIDNDDDKKTAQMVLLRYIWVSFFLHHLLNNGYNDKLLLEKYKIKLNKWKQNNQKNQKKI